MVKKDIEVVVKEASPVAVTPDFSAESLILKAIENNLPVETMERLLAMRRELKAEFAKEQYDIAMAKFQSECPVIHKKTKVKDKHGSPRYNYAKLDDIVSQTQKLIAQNDFSYKFEVTSDATDLTALCIVTHKSGHKETSPFKIPISKEEYMTEVQKMGARSTYAKRYAFCNAFGIMTGDSDIDGAVGKPDDVKPQEKTGKAKTIANVIEAISKCDSIDQLEKVKLNVMASKILTDEIKNESLGHFDARLHEITQVTVE